MSRDDHRTRRNGWFRRYRCGLNIWRRYMGSAKAAGPGPIAPIGVNHIVLNVRDMDESHQFWTEVVGLRLIGEFRQRAGRAPPARMRVYNGLGTARPHH